MTSGTNDDTAQSAAGVGAGAGLNPGDLGRRVKSRREALHLTPEELAERAGMHPSYLSYLESQADARPTPAACARLAASLGTSVAWLRGGGLDQPAGSGHSPTAVATLDELGDEECLALVAAGGIGRVAFDDSRGPVALPVNFRMLGSTVLFRTGHGSIEAAVRVGQTLSLEVDHLDEAMGEGWSVLLTGVASEVDDPTVLDKVANLDLHPWAGGDRTTVVQLEPVQTTGRRIRHH